MRIPLPFFLGRALSVSSAALQFHSRAPAHSPLLNHRPAGSLHKRRPHGCPLWELRTHCRAADTTGTTRPRLRPAARNAHASPSGKLIRIVRGHTNASPYMPAGPRHRTLEKKQLSTAACTTATILAGPAILLCHGSSRGFLEGELCAIALYDA